MSFNFPPKGWAQCNGLLLPINQNQPLFSLFGTMYGGDGRVNFGLPDLRGRVPMHVGSGYVQGQKLGEEFHTLNQSEMPAHNHIITANELTTINPETLALTGGNQPHENRPPFLVTNWCVALQGIFPSRN